MSFGTISLNDGTTAPSPAFGTGTALKGRDAKEQVLQALQNGQRHLDCAQFYGNEGSVGEAIAASGLPRSSLYITTKYATGDISTSLRTSLQLLQVDYVDLYLLHSVKFAEVHGLSRSWEVMESLQRDGLTRSIGVSNYRVGDLEILGHTAHTMPAVNQVEFHPFVYNQATKLQQYCHDHGIALASYAGLAPLTKTRHGDFDAVVKRLASKYAITEHAVLYNWLRKHGVLVVTTSSKKERLEEMHWLAREISHEDSAELDRVGSQYHHRYYMSFMDE
ncbi:hypothetical protein E3P78_01211 [Wallemia ichthyophaga]|nr:hypothetical protein E3P78_01211 [Wallemia ichthyophaga]